MILKTITNIILQLSLVGFFAVVPYNAGSKDWFFTVLPFMAVLILVRLILALEDLA